MNLELEIAEEIQVSIKAESQNSICVNCVQSDACVFKSNNVFECEEHATDYAGDETPVIKEIERHFAATTAQNGICGTCTQAPSCIWNTEESIKFQCEHYQ
jgi:hypothetical protein